MNPIAALGAGLATVAASLALAAPAAAQNATCTLTAQPWDGRSYALTAVVDGTPTPLITKQSGLLEGQTSWTFTAPSGVAGDLTGVTQVWWAARNPARQATAADFYDVLGVRPDCTFTTPYKADPGHQDSVVIRPGTPAPTTTTTPPPTTTTTTTTTAPPPIETVRTTPTSPTTTGAEVTTTIARPVVDVPLAPAPSTTAPIPPTVPSPPVVDLYTATSVERQAGTLPVTGSAWLVYALHVAGYLIGVGGAMLALCLPARRRLARETTQR